LLRPNFYSPEQYRRLLAFQFVFFFPKKVHKHIQAGYSAVNFSPCASAKPQRRPQHSRKTPFSDNFGVSSPAVNELWITVADPAYQFDCGSAPDPACPLLQIRILAFTLNPFFVFDKFFPRSFISDGG
jgi:hypothetical protein